VNQQDLLFFASAKKGKKDCSGNFYIRKMAFFSLIAQNSSGSIMSEKIKQLVLLANIFLCQTFTIIFHPILRTCFLPAAQNRNSI